MLASPPGDSTSIIHCALSFPVNSCWSIGVVQKQCVHHIIVRLLTAWYMQCQFPCIPPHLCARQMVLNEDQSDFEGGIGIHGKVEVMKPYPYHWISHGYSRNHWTSWYIPRKMKRYPLCYPWRHHSDHWGQFPFHCYQAFRDYCLCSPLWSHRWHLPWQQNSPVHPVIFGGTTSYSI